MNSKEYFSAGELMQAIKSLDNEIRTSPSDMQKRGFLVELLCISRDLERADKQLDIIIEQDSKLATSISLVKQLIRAENIRQQCFYEGRLPEFINNTLSDEIKMHLEALTYLRKNNLKQANKILEEVANMQPNLKGTCNEQPFSVIRDLDDSCLSFLEIFTSTGKYYWISFKDIKTLEFQAPTNPIDLIWRQTKIEVRNGPDGVVYVPTIYSSPNQNDKQLMGRETDWLQDIEGPVLGKGQRMFLVGENVMPIMEIHELTIDE